jgi:hypothetical protein
MGLRVAPEAEATGAAAEVGESNYKSTRGHGDLGDKDSYWEVDCKRQKIRMNEYGRDAVWELRAKEPGPQVTGTLTVRFVI